MGFLGDLWNKGKAAAAAAWDTVKTFVAELRAPKKPDTVTGTPAYKPEAGTGYTQSIDDRIHDFLQENLPSAGKTETRLLEICQNSFFEHVAKVKEYVSKRQLDIDVSELDRASQALEKKFSGALERHIKSHFSLSDKDCLAAFSVSDASRRSRSVMRHWNVVVNDGLMVLGKNVAEYFSDQNELIQDSIRSRAEQQHEIVRMERAQLIQLLELNNADHSVKEQAKTRVQFVVDCCDVLAGRVAD